MRTLAAARDEGKMNVVSDKLNWHANACMVWESKHAPSSNTHNELPVSAPCGCVNTLTMRNRWVDMRTLSFEMPFSNIRGELYADHPGRSRCRCQPLRAEYCGAPAQRARPRIKNE